MDKLPASPTHIRWPHWLPGATHPIPAKLCGAGPDGTLSLDPWSFFDTMPPNGVGRCPYCVAIFVRLEHEPLALARGDVQAVAIEGSTGYPLGT